MTSYPEAITESGDLVQEIIRLKAVGVQCGVSTPLDEVDALHNHPDHQ